MQDKMITINISLADKQIRLKIPRTMTLHDLKTQVVMQIVPEDPESLNEFDENLLKKLQPRLSFHHENPFLVHSNTAPSTLETNKIETTETTNSIDTRADFDIKEEEEDADIGSLYMCALDPDESLVVKEKPLSVAAKKKIKKKLDRARTFKDCDKEEVFVYKGQILDCEKTLADYSVTDYSTIYYGKPKKVTFKNISVNKLETFYTTSETLAGELREMANKMGLLQPQEELLFNNRTLSDHDIPDSASTNDTSRSQDDIELECKRKVVRVLSLDGGGIRGVAVATILEEIENMTKKPIRDLFDVIVGTSTGGLLAIMMTIPTKDGHILTAAEAKQVYIDKRYEMFKKNPWFRNSLANPKYTGDSFEKVVKDLYGDTTLRAAVKPMGVVVTDYNLHKPMLINSMRAQVHEDDYRHNIPVWKAARGTTAAPTFFPPVVLGCSISEKQRRSVSPTQINEPPSYIRGSITLEDGGTTTNNPTLLGIKYAQRALAATGTNLHHDIQVVSIGTGNLQGFESPPPVIDGNGSLLNFVSKFSKDPLFISRNSYNIHNQVMNDYFEGKEGSGSDYFRVQFKISKEQWQHMDNCDMSNLKGLINAAKFYMYADFGFYSNHFQGIINLLNQDVSRPSLKLDIMCPNCQVRTRYYTFLSDYFSHQRWRVKVATPTFLKDIYETLKVTDKAYHGARSKPKFHKKWLIDMLKAILKEKILESILTAIYQTAGKCMEKLPDKGQKEVTDLKAKLLELDFDSVLGSLEVKGTLSEVFHSRDNIFKGLAKSIRKTVLDSQLYREILNIAKSQFELCAHRVWELYKAEREKKSATIG